MFDLVSSVAGFAVSFVYPAYQTYQLLSSVQTGPVTKQLVENLSGTVAIPRETLSLFEDCIAYWLILAGAYFVASFPPVRFLLELVPFSSLVLLYLRAWLALPLVRRSDRAVSGAHVIYKYYLYDLLQVVSEYIETQPVGQLIGGINTSKSAGQRGSYRSGASSSSSSSTAASTLASVGAVAGKLGLGGGSGSGSGSGNGNWGNGGAGLLGKVGGLAGSLASGLSSVRGGQASVLFDSLVSPLTNFAKAAESEGYEVVYDEEDVKMSRENSYVNLETPKRRTSSSRSRSRSVSASSPNSKPGSKPTSRKTSSKGWWKAE